MMYFGTASNEYHTPVMAGDDEGFRKLLYEYGIEVGGKDPVLTVKQLLVAFFQLADVETREQVIHSVHRVISTPSPCVGVPFSSTLSPVPRRQ